MSTTNELIASHTQLWQSATQATFLDGVADGTLSTQSFDGWLEQDHHFVRALISAWGLVLQTAPRQDLSLLARGIEAFTAELDWFDDVAQQRHHQSHQSHQSHQCLDLHAAVMPATAAYNQVLIRLAAGPYEQAITAMWAVEAAYLQAWQQVAPGSDAYAEYVAHWSDAQFEGFVADLAEVVNRELPTGPTPLATTAFVAVARHEAAFWAAMTLQP